MIMKKKSVCHSKNDNGGITGGVSNGEPLVVKLSAKPIPSQKKPLKSVNIISREHCYTFKERGDLCAVPSIAVVSQNLVAIVICRNILNILPGNCMEDVLDIWQKIKKEKYFLVGMPGVGKSTIGKLVAEKLGWKFYDIDTMIEKKEKKINRRYLFLIMMKIISEW